jgi:cytoplasmic iron level regulating protein YaaA (DUF328/UPF0246 family)
MPRLLILACSARKRLDRSALPAIERYDGVNFRILKKLQREHAFPHDLDVLILSAKYGLLRPETPIEAYNLKMTEARAAELCALFHATWIGTCEKKNTTAFSLIWAKPTSTHLRSRAN